MQKNGNVTMFTRVLTKAKNVDSDFSFCAKLALSKYAA